MHSKNFWLLWSGCGGVNIFSFKLILRIVCFFLLFFQFVLKIFLSMIQWFVWKFLASFFVSIMSSYLAFGWSFIWLVIPFVSYRDGAIFIFICSLFLRPYHLFFRDGAVFIWFIWVRVIGSFCREVHFGHCEASRDFINL